MNQERTHPLGAVTAAQLNSVVQLVKRQLVCHEKRLKERAESEEDEEEDTEDEEEVL